MALTLGNRTKPRNRRPRGVNANFATVEHAKTKNIAVLDRASADNLGKEAQADAHQAARLASLEVLNPLRLFLA